MKKIIAGAIGIISCLVILNTYASPIKIIVNGDEFNCDYSLLKFMNGETQPELTLMTNGQGQICTVSTDNNPGTGGDIPTPVAPISLQQDSNGLPVNRVSEIRWQHVEGATSYNLIMYRQSNNNALLINRTLTLGAAGVQGQVFNQACGGVSGGEDCVFVDPNSNGVQDLFFGAPVNSRELPDDDYQWQVRVLEPAELETSFSDATANFIINAQQETEASETAAEFDNANANQNFDPTTGEFDYASKVQLINMLDTPPFNSYQQIAGGKEIFIVNRSDVPETVIPSCVNGKIKNPASLPGSNCVVDIPFGQNEIYALRFRTNATGAAGQVFKTINQIAAREPAFYDVTISKFPGRMLANQADDFQGRCSTRTFNAGGEFSLLTSPSSSSPTVFCTVPSNTRIYVNVTLAPNQTQCVDGPGPTGFVCQIDINSGGLF